jgi:hypothetical protein
MPLGFGKGISYEPLGNAKIEIILGPKSNPSKAGNGLQSIGFLGEANLLI